MSHKSRQTSDDTNEAKRIPTAIVLSVVVNLLFLTGAATILRERVAPTSPSGETAYVTLERVEERPVEQQSRPSMPNDPPAESSRPSSSVRGAMLSPIPDRARTVPPEPEPTPSLSAQSGTLQRPRPVVSAAQKAVNEPSPPPIAVPAPREVTGTEVAGDEIAASNVISGDSSASLSESGNGVPLEPGVPKASPEVSPTPGPVAAVPVGVTRSAELAYQELPRLPDALRESGYRSFVRVAVEVLEDGSFTVVIRTSSGNPDIDARVLEALKRWKWKPALENGVAVTSTQLFRFDFDVD